jgi:hypothetical protein
MAWKSHFLFLGRIFALKFISKFLWRYSKIVSPVKAGACNQKEKDPRLRGEGNGKHDKSNW